jgi:hypothetical protein
MAKFNYWGNDRLDMLFIGGTATKGGHLIQNQSYRPAFVM